MWSVGDRLECFLGRRRSLLVLRGEVLLDGRCESAEEALEQVAERLATITLKGRVRVWLNGGLCRPVLLKASHGLRSAREVDMAIQSLATHSFGEEGPFRLWLEPARGADRSWFGAAALEGMVQSIEQRLHRLGRGPVQISPWWADAMAAAGPDACCIVVCDDDSVTLVCEEQGSVIQVRTAGPMSSDHMQATVQRWRVAGDIPGADAVEVRLADRARSEPDPALALGAVAEVVR